MAEPGVCVQSVRVPLLAAAARTGRPLAELAREVRIGLPTIGDPTARGSRSRRRRQPTGCAAKRASTSAGRIAAAASGVPW
jgi:hypothetical protein